MENYIEKDGKVYNDKNEVAVVISPNFGSGWTTWTEKLSPFEPKVVFKILSGKVNDINSYWCKKELGLDVYIGSNVDELEIVWIPSGTKFSINEYDGSESIYRCDELDYVA